MTLLQVDNVIVFNLGNAMLHGRPRVSQVDLLEPLTWSVDWDAPVEIPLPCPVGKDKKKTKNAKVSPPQAAKKGVKRERSEDFDEQIRPWFRFLVSAKGKTERPLDMKDKHPLTYQEFQETSSFDAVYSFLKYQKIFHVGGGSH